MLYFECIFVSLSDFIVISSITSKAPSTLKPRVCPARKHRRGCTAETTRPDATRSHPARSLLDAAGTRCALPCARPVAHLWTGLALRTRCIFASSPTLFFESHRPFQTKPGRTTHQRRDPPLLQLSIPPFAFDSGNGDAVRTLRLEHTRYQAKPLSQRRGHIVPFCFAGIDSTSSLELRLEAPRSAIHRRHITSVPSPIVRFLRPPQAASDDH